MAVPTELQALAFLEGTWVGEGVGGYPTIEGFRYGQELTVAAYPGRPVLSHRSRTWALDDPDRPMALETGWWRVDPGGTVELLLAHAFGVTEMSIGQVRGSSVELATDVLVRTATAKEVGALRRLYGLVGDELMYAVDMAAVGQPLQPHVSARLRRA